jgi:tricorn protease
MIQANATRARGLLVAIILLLCAGTGLAADANPLWMRYPAISPDGQSIVFSFRGDLYTVAAEGGLASPLTLHAAHDTQPIWSPDGKWIAFASDRYGNTDIFLIAADGGQARRLTVNSSEDTPCSFTPDGKNVLFTATRMDAVTHIEFPHYRALPELYSVPVDAGRPTQVLTNPALQSRMDSKGDRLLYSEQTGLENFFRKHNKSTFARDIWLVDMKTGKQTRITDYEGDDRDPVWTPDQQDFFFLSERAGDFNIFRQNLADGRVQQLTRHKTHPVRFLSSSTDGDLCYGFDGEIYVLDAGADKGRRVPVMIRSEDPHNALELIPLSRNITEFNLSPTGKEIVFINRGEIFVTAVDHRMTKRVTNTPEQERSVSFSPDGRSLVYASERDGSWNLYRTDLARDDEPYFFGATLLTESPILEIKDETYQPHWSPDGKEVSYLQERVELKVITLENKRTRTIMPGKYNYSYADGDQWYQWSPDGKWFLVNFLSPERWSDEVGLVAADGKGDVINLTRSGYEDGGPVWAMDGKMMMWFSDKNGLRAHGGWRTTDDVMGMFFTQDAWDRYHMSKAEVAVADAMKKDDDKKDDDKKDDDAEDKKDKEERTWPDGFKPKKLPDPLTIELDGIQDRTARLTIHAASIADAVMTPDGEQLLYLARFEKGLDLWSYKHREDEVELLAKLGADRAGGMELDADGKHVFLLADGQLKKIAVDSGKPKPVAFSATMELNAAAEREYMFEHVWRQMYKKFYKKDMHGVDWKMYKKEYAKFLPWINNNYDLAEMLSEMLGELNASHTGSRHINRSEGGHATATLGAFYDPEYEGDGLKISEIVAKGPLVKAKAGIKAGMIIEKIDGREIKAGENWYPLMNRKAGKSVLLSIYDADADKDKRRRDVVVKPISRRQLGNLLYDRWVENRRQDVERMSGGRLGYAHVRSMNSRSYRDAFADIMGRYSDKEGLVVDTRFNSGGNLTEFLADFLRGVQYSESVPRGQHIGREPSMSWTRPSIVVQNEGNYSDAHYFPWVYRELGIGKLVGTQVPGTATAVWWETLQDPSIYFGIPQVGVMNNRGELLENQNLEPDVYQDNEPNVSITGLDQQLQKAVEILLQDIDNQ